MTHVENFLSQNSNISPSFQVYFSKIDKADNKFNYFSIISIPQWCQYTDKFERKCDRNYCIYGWVSVTRYGPQSAASAKRLMETNFNRKIRNRSDRYLGDRFTLRGQTGYFVSCVSWVNFLPLLVDLDHCTTFIRWRFRRVVWIFC